MCLSTAYTVSQETETVVAKFVSKIEINNGIVTLTDVMGATTEIPGELFDVDLINNTVKIRVAA